jgi:hypothetical protein
VVLSGSPASSTTKTSRHDIDELLLKVALKHQKSNQSIIIKLYCLSVQCMCEFFTPKDSQSKSNNKKN